MHSLLIVRRRLLAVLLGLCLAASAAPSSADVWDNDPGNEDDSSNTDNGAISRFNNFGSQVTTLILQSPTDYTISGTVYFWDSLGTQVGSQPFILLAKRLSVINTASIAPGVGGSITITQNGRFGDLQGKSVALEPATGFSFDTPLEYRTH
jgi:hypothetical protein